ncbi:MAG TPA: hypothetical protein VN721_02575 [Flavipsychrobacter sp.]|nr:hypothetical protein [Flavipsychrobacter sp.]
MQKNVATYIVANHAPSNLKEIVKALKRLPPVMIPVMVPMMTIISVAIVAT